MFYIDGKYVILNIISSIVMMRLIFIPVGRNVFTIAVEQDFRINDEIIGYESCRLIDEEGVQLGIFALPAAKDMADERGLDLVELTCDSEPPVCRIMNYGKFKYDRQKKEKTSRKNQSKIETKEMKFRPGIGIGDYNTKKKHISHFLKIGNKVKITIMFRGREMSHPELGTTILERLIDDLSSDDNDIQIVQHPLMEGRNMTMILSPNK